MNDLERLIGKTLFEVQGLEDGSEVVNLVTTEGDILQMYHRQDCCEFVRVEEVFGDVDWLVGSPIVTAECRIGDNQLDTGSYESATWTFYEFATNKGSVTIRWLGTSNGYYGEGVDTFWIIKSKSNETDI